MCVIHSQSKAVSRFSRALSSLSEVLPRWSSNSGGGALKIKRFLTSLGCCNRNCCFASISIVRFRLMLCSAADFLGRGGASRSSLRCRFQVECSKAFVKQTRFLGQVVVSHNNAILVMTYDRRLQVYSQQQIIDQIIRWKVKEEAFEDHQFRVRNSFYTLAWVNRALPSGPHDGRHRSGSLSL